MDSRSDLQIRIASFEWLAHLVDIHGEVLKREPLLKGFLFQGNRVPLISPQGIFKPAVMDLPLTITTVFGGPYDDAFSPGGRLNYRYRGTDPTHRDNVGLRKVKELGLPLIYFHGIDRGKYLATWPVYVVGDEPSKLTFKVEVDQKAQSRKTESSAEIGEGWVADPADEGRRLYVTSEFRRRIHQHSFRERVLKAYRDQCALCRLKHRELLDAAHIIPDSEPEGEPRVSNGLSLCKLHHAAFDSLLLGVSPDYIVEVRPDVLEESDGPMLRYGLQGMHRQGLILPRGPDLHPNRDGLAWRYEQFKSAS